LVRQRDARDVDVQLGGDAAHGRLRRDEGRGGGDEGEELEHDGGGGEHGLWQRRIERHHQGNGRASNGIETGRGQAHNAGHRRSLSMHARSRIHVAAAANRAERSV
jgi:hypothetical protein